MTVPAARLYFQQTITRPEVEIDLAQAALYIAQEEYPDLEVETYLKALDTMAAEIQARLPTVDYPLRVIQTINQYLYEDLGFSGNSADYYDPRNSFLNDVIDRRMGIPITLSLVYLEVAKRLDFPMVGVNMPGHFLIRPDVPEMEVFVDPFYRGEVLFVEDCQDRLSQIYGQQVEVPMSYQDTISTRRFLGRMLTNLKIIYLNRNDLSKALAAMERILLLFPENALERRDRGILYYRLSRWQEATDDLVAYLNQVPNAADRGMIQQVLEQLRSGMP